MESILELAIIIIVSDWKWLPIGGIEVIQKQCKRKKSIVATLH